MIKLVRMVKRRKGMSFEEFKSHWMKTHLVLERKLVQEPGIQRLVVSFPVQMLGGDEAPFDAMVEIYAEGTDDFDRLMSSDVIQALQEDEMNFLDIGAPRIRALTEEVVLQRGGEGV